MFFTLTTSITLCSPKFLKALRFVRVLKRKHLKLQNLKNLVIEVIHSCGSLDIESDHRKATFLLKDDSYYHEGQDYEYVVKALNLTDAGVPHKYGYDNWGDKNWTFLINFVGIYRTGLLPRFRSFHFAFAKTDSHHAKSFGYFSSFYSITNCRAGIFRSASRACNYQPAAKTTGVFCGKALSQENNLCESAAPLPSCWLAGANEQFAAKYQTIRFVPRLSIFYHKKDFFASFHVMVWKFGSNEFIFFSDQKLKNWKK